MNTLAEIASAIDDLATMIRDPRTSMVRRNIATDGLHEIARELRAVGRG